MPRKRRGGRAAPVTLQFSVQYAMPKDRRFRMSKAVLDEAIKYWIENEGEEPEGFKITPISWTHGNKTTEADSTESFLPLLGRLLQAGTPIRYTIRGHEGIQRA